MLKAGWKKEIKSDQKCKNLPEFSLDITPKGARFSHANLWGLDNPQAPFTQTHITKIMANVAFTLQTKLAPDTFGLSSDIWRSSATAGAFAVDAQRCAGQA